MVYSQWISASAPIGGITNLCEGPAIGFALTSV